MLKKIQNNKGFTLIELLAVIVIMGVLMIVAIPMVTKYIDQSKRDAYVDTAKAYINSARYSFLNDEYSCAATTTGATNYLVALSSIEVDKSGGKSPYSKSISTGSSYVKIALDASGKATYSICIMDDGNNGTQGKFVEEQTLKRSDIKRNTAGTCPTSSITVCTSTNQ